MRLMNFDFKVITKSFWGICLVISAVFFIIGNNGIGGLFLFIAVVGFLAQLIFSSRR